MHADRFDVMWDPPTRALSTTSAESTTDVIKVAYAVLYRVIGANAPWIEIKGDGAEMGALEHQVTISGLVSGTAYVIFLTCFNVMLWFVDCS